MRPGRSRDSARYNVPRRSAPRVPPPQSATIGPPGCHARLPLLCDSNSANQERPMNPALKKGLAIIGVALLLLIPLAWLHALVSERTALREQAIASVARGWGGRQLL